MNKKSRQKKARLAAVAVLMMTIMFSSQQVSAKEEIQVREEGLKSIIQGVAISQNTQKAVKRIGTSFEVVLVGQRMGKREIQSRLDFGNQGAEEVKRLKEKSIGFTENKLVMSDEDYNTLLKIVEAEAGGEDIKGKILPFLSLSLYLSISKIALSFNGTRTIIGRSSFVLCGMYSIAPLMILSGLIFIKSDTRQPIRH